LTSHSSANAFHLSHDNLAKVGYFKVSINSSAKWRENSEGSLKETITYKIIDEADKEEWEEDAVVNGIERWDDHLYDFERVGSDEAAADIRVTIARAHVTVAEFLQAHKI
jgi:hypothetical protein